MKVFIFHHTQDLQDYNEHEVFATLDEAQTAFNEARDFIKKEASIFEIYNDGEDEFYFDTSNGQEKLYITEHEI